MANDLRIMAWNANGVLQHQSELQVVLDIEKIDVCLLSETHLTNEQNIKFKGYNVYLTNHPQNTAKGGSAVIIKENILHYEESPYRTREIQASSVSVNTKNYRLTITAVYSPPRHAIKEKLYLDFLRMQGNRFIVGGDFNAKNSHWGSRLTTTKGKELLKAIRKNGCEALSTGKPTYWPTDTNKIPDLIDFFIVKNISTNFVQVEEGWDMYSDHSPILLTLSEKVIKKSTKPMLTNKSTNWEGFKQSLERNINLSVPLKTEEYLDNEVELFNKNIQQAAWENTQEIKQKVTGNNYPREIRKMITEKRKIRRKYQQSRSPHDKRILNNITQKLRREIQQIKNETMNAYLIELTDDASTDYSLWRATKKIKRPVLQIPPIRLENGKWASSNEQKATRFAEYLEKVFSPNKEDEESKRLLPDVLGQENQENDESRIRLTTLKEVKSEIKNNINIKKAPGFELITGEILKQLPRKALVKLTNLINASFRLKYVPTLWKVAEVIMIHKPGKPPHEASSYRPISLLPVISKLFERLLLKRMKPIIEEREIIPNHQFGFRCNHSTIDQVHRIVNIIEKCLEEKKICSAVFLDVSQAFDKVWHEGLIYKLKSLLPKQFCEILQSYITDRFFRIKQENQYSELKQIMACVPQGSILGPILYLR